MSDFQNRGYLTSKQYKDAGNLNTRILLHQRFSTNPYGWFHWVFDQLCQPSGAKILEIGCGSGRLWLENVERIPVDWEITLSDLSTGMLQDTRENLASPNNAFSYKVIDAEELPFSDCSFDAVIANHMLYHLPDRPKALAGIARVLKPNGCFYAATNGENHLRELHEIMPQLPHPSGSFTLENGRQQLVPWFTDIEIRRYDDSLVVTEAEPLIAYIHSMVPRIVNPGVQKGPGLEILIRRMIYQDGSIQIQESAGIFIARKKA